MNTNDSSIVFHRDRELVRGILVDLVLPPTQMDQSSMIYQRLGSVGPGLVPALAVFIDDEDPKIGFLAARLFYRMANTANGHPEFEQRITRAHDRIASLLNHDDQSLVLFACVSLAYGSVPINVTKRLVRLASSKDPDIAVYAAAALSWCGEEALRGLSVLMRALHGENVDQIRVAADALARLGIRKQEATDALVRRLDDSPPNALYAVILALRDIGVPARKALPSLVRILADNSLGVLVRAAAAQALGSIGKSDPAIPKRLIKVLWDSSPAVVEGGILGLHHANRLGKDHVARLSELLSAESCEMRLVAAQGLQLANRHLEAFVDRLMDSLLHEQDHDVLIAVGRAISVLGRPVANRLCELIVSHGIMPSLGVGIAINFFKTEGAAAIGEIVLKADDEVVSWQGICLLRGFGDEAAVAAPQLASLLPKLSNDRVTLTLSMFEASKLVVLELRYALVDCLVSRTGDAARKAGELLRSLGETGVQAVVERRSNATFIQLAKIDEWVANDIPQPNSQHESMLRLDADKDLQLFMYVGKVLAEHGPIGIRKVSDYLESISEIDVLNLSISDASIRMMLKALSDKLGYGLSESTCRGSQLTSKGQVLLGQLDAYLRWRGLSI